MTRTVSGTLSALLRRELVECDDNITCASLGL
jgi:hypothetical protein